MAHSLANGTENLVMTFSSAFPTKYVDRSDVDYRKVPWHQFFLIPREDGSSPQDYIRTWADLQSALEIKSLGACLRNNVLNDNRLDQGYYYDIPHIKAYYPRNRSKHDAISL